MAERLMANDVQKELIKKKRPTITLGPDIINFDDIKIAKIVPTPAAKKDKEEKKEVRNSATVGVAGGKAFILNPADSFESDKRKEIQSNGIPAFTMTRNTGIRSDEKPVVRPVGGYTPTSIYNAPKAKDSLSVMAVDKTVPQSATGTENQARGAAITYLREKYTPKLKDRILGKKDSTGVTSAGAGLQAAPLTANKEFNFGFGGGGVQAKYSTSDLDAKVVLNLSAIKVQAEKKVGGGSVNASVEVGKGGTPQYAFAWTVQQ